MQAQDLALKCLDNLSRGLTHIQLVIPPRKFPRGFPKGELLCENSNGDRVYLFDCRKILRLFKAE
jgi:hypothetical protein